MAGQEFIRATPARIAALPACRRRVLGAVMAWTLAGAALGAPEPRRQFESPWKRHTIDNSSTGADGVRLADANADGWRDIVTGWEEGGLVRLYVHPGPEKARASWPAVTVGRVKSVEDAVLVDLDGDGALEVVSSCEGRVKGLFVHWAPRGRDHLLDGHAWTTEPLPAAAGRMQWMFGLPLQVDGRHGLDLVAGGKGEAAAIGWFEAPANPRELAAWKWHALRPAGWTMSLVAEDMDGDGDHDVLLSDRRGGKRGVYWLEHPGGAHATNIPWTEHPVGGQGREVMFLAVGDLDADGLRDVVVATKPRDLLFLRRQSRGGKEWEPFVIPQPHDTGGAKAVNIADLDGDGRMDLVFSCESAANRHGLMWLSPTRAPTEPAWQPHAISGHDGIKHDLVEVLDLDGDGDLDVLTCEETKGLGVIWYENPLR